MQVGILHISSSSAHARMCQLLLLVHRVRHELRASSKKMVVDVLCLRHACTTAAVSALMHTCRRRWDQAFQKLGWWHPAGNGDILWCHHGCCFVARSCRGRPDLSGGARLSSCE